ncbi:DUF6491 family protein [Hephaestia mangrovi]|uniref:DUF6491 family protein n=1 Tax=Hephaestia mangrovi TaxID=2873268 RepID=UPI001CA7193D|nr:DUF6491 family protein [Hephaestia mangrovi]MBY8828639.1 DUF6491 family protein [Hephaestia mangrovi]
MRMMPSAVFALLALSGATGALAAQHERPIGKETSIPFADHHGLRDWAEGPTDDQFYVQDYRNDWYLVKLSGPCIGNMTALRVAYTTGPGGAFDLFSHVFSTDYPEMTCAVTSITTSLAPPERQKKQKKD